MSSTAGAALERLGRTISTEIMTTLDENLDIQGAIDRAIEAVGDVGEALRSGASLGEAIEIGFDLEDSPIRRIESMLNAVALGFLDAIAAVLDIAGRGDLAEDLRGQITEFAGGQLAFDLQITDGAEGVARTVSGALARGVDEAQVGESVQQAIDERLAAGDIAGAQAIADGVAAAVDQGLSDLDMGAFGRRMFNVVAGTGGDVNALMEALGVDRLEDATAEALVAAVSRMAAETDNELLAQEITGNLQAFGVDTVAALAGLDMRGATVDIATALDEAQTRIDELVAGADEAMNASDFDTAAAALTEAIDLVRSTGDETYAEALEISLAFVEDLQAAGEQSTDTEDEISTAMDNTEAAIGDFETNSQQKLSAAGSHFTTYQSTATGALAQVDASIDATAAKLAALRDSIDNAPTNVPDTPPETAVTERAAGGPLPAGVTLVGEEGPELITSDSAAGFVINAASTNAIMQAVATALGGGTGGGGNTYVNMYNTINTSNQAAADAFGLRTATVVRGFAT